MKIEESQPLYVISVVAKMIGVHAQTLRYYEREGLIQPSRSAGRIRLYSMRDIEKLQRVKTLMDELGVNLAGVEIILNLMDRIADMERQMKAMEQELGRSGEVEA